MKIKSILKLWTSGALKTDSPKAPSLPGQPQGLVDVGRWVWMDLLPRDPDGAAAGGDRAKGHCLSSHSGVVSYQWLTTDWLPATMVNAGHTSSLRPTLAMLWSLGWCESLMPLHSCS